MSILREIHSWSKSLVPWQQDAIARLCVNRVLSEADIEDLYALAKQAAGIADTEGRVPRPLQDAEIAPSLDPTRTVQLVAIKDISHVNALAEGGSLPFSPIGLTVIYGENGAGKSGYSRILKHACRARDRSEALLPDARLDPNSVGTPKASFEVIVDGQALELEWVHKTSSPAELADISIFDSHCARAYIDNDGDFAYTPYGLDILEGLVALCERLKRRAIDEKTTNTPSNSAYVALTQQKTAVAAALNGIPAHTKAGDIEALAVLTEEEQCRLEVLTKTLAEVDPKQKAQAIRERVMRLTALKTRLTSAMDVVSEGKIDQLRNLIEKQKTARGLADSAAEGFKGMPGQLAGTGGEQWKELFEAARAFAVFSHESHEFPNLPPESQCPLCQNTLGPDGAERLRIFDSFIRNRAEQTAKQARRVAEEAYTTLNQANLSVGFEESLQVELAGLDASLAAACLAFQAALLARQASVRQAAGYKLPWEEISGLPGDVRPPLQVVIDGLQVQIKALEASADEKLRIAMLAEKGELEARRRLADIKDAVLESIRKYEFCAKLQRCVDGLGTTAISRKSTELSSTMARDEVVAALNEELKRLKVHDLRVVMKPVSTKGRAQFKLALELPGGGRPAAILSEGEQRAIALASFFAEISLANGKGGAVFDDPVSSLDHRRRWEVAERLAKEALVRQIIVFTHDLYFLCFLEQKAEQARISILKSYIRKAPQGFGVHSQELPFDVLSTKDRVRRLRDGLVKIETTKKLGDEDEQRRLTTEAYGKLRLAWERAVEEVLFNGAVQRFGEGVYTRQLKAVTVTDDDYRQIYAGMTKSSKFEHDASLGVGRLPLPDPDEIRTDIQCLEEWRVAVHKRRASTEAARP